MKYLKFLALFFLLSACKSDKTNDVANSEQPTDQYLKELISNKKISNRFEVYIEDMKNQPNSLFLSEIAQKDLDFKEIIVFNNLYLSILFNRPN